MDKIPYTRPQAQLLTIRVVDLRRGREYLRAIAHVCQYAADHPDGREVMAMLRTLRDMPVMLRRQRLQ